MRSLFIIPALLAIFCCSEDSEQTEFVNREPSVTEIGDVTGETVTQNIGAVGGSISSADGVLHVIIPPNAVTSNTPFSIQPIINHCPGGIFAYRVLPAGLEFTNPVTLIFNLTDDATQGLPADFLGIAYQGSDRIWYSLPSAIVDENSKTITVGVKHFTDWAAIAFLEISPRDPLVPELKVNQSLSLSLFGIDLSLEEDELPPLPTSPPDNPSPDEDELPPLPQPLGFEVEWFVNGVKDGNSTFGTMSLVTRAPIPTYKYTAPSRVPSNNTVLVSAEITGLKKWLYVGGQPKVTRHNKVIVYKRIKIRSDEFNFKLEAEYRDGAACAYLGNESVDRVSMDVKVKGDEVSFANIVNVRDAISPRTISVQPPGVNISCTVTCDPSGGAGYFNVVGATGEVTPGLDDGERLVISLTNTGCSTPYSEVVCPNLPAAIGQPTTYAHEDVFYFELKDAAQRYPNEGKYGLFVKLTPQ